MTPRWLRLLPCLTVLAVLGQGGGAGAEEADDAAALAFLREELVKEATVALADGQASLAALRAMRRSLDEDVRFAKAYKPGDEEERALLEAFRQTLSERAMLGGRPDPDDGAAEGDSGHGGALFEGGLVLDWLRGEHESTTRVRRSTSKSERPREYVYPPPLAQPTTPPVPAAAPNAEEEGRAGDTQKSGDAPKEGADTPGNRPPAPKGQDGADPTEPADAPRKAGKPAPDTGPVSPAEVTAQPQPAPDPATWTRDVVRPAEGGSLTRLQFEVVPGDWLDDLLQAAAAQPTFRHPDVGAVRRCALVTPADPAEIFAYNAPLVALRAVQAAERNAAMQSDQPQPTLVSSGIVHEKEEAVERYGALVDRHAGRRRQIRAVLDRMVIDLDAWKTQAALLAVGIEDRRRSLEEAGTAPRDDLRVRLAQSREALASMEITLLYTTVLRAGDRLALLEGLERSAHEEAAAAQQVFTRYLGALQTLRSTRRLDRLGGDRRSLQRWIAGLTERGAANGSVAERRLTAYRAMLALNDLVQDAVRRRQIITGGASAAAVSQGEPRGQPEPDAPRTLSTLVQNPARASWDPDYVQLAQRALDDPELAEEFDATLVAAHFAAVNDRIAGLMKAHRAAEGQEELIARFDAAVGTAEAALAPLSADRLIVQVRRLPGMLQSEREDFSASMSSIAEQRARNRKHMRTLVDYRTHLRNQGTRSLLIRIQRSLEDPFVGDALQDTRSVLDSAGAWATFQGERHAGGFMQESWPRVLLILAALLAVFFLARFGRRAVDGWIERRLADFPAADGKSASVREERERAREHVAAAVAADVERSADDVLRHGLEDRQQTEASSEGDPSPERDGVDEAAAGGSPGKPQS